MGTSSLAITDAPDPDFERFLTRVAPGPGDCLVWTGETNNGYGRFTLSDGTPVSAGRWLYERTLGSLPPGTTLKRTCGVPACVEPNHGAPNTRSASILVSFGLTTAQTDSIMATGRNLSTVVEQAAGQAMAVRGVTWPPLARQRQQHRQTRRADRPTVMHGVLFSREQIEVLAKVAGPTRREQAGFIVTALGELLRSSPGGLAAWSTD